MILYSMASKTTDLEMYKVQEDKLQNLKDQLVNLRVKKVHFEDAPLESFNKVGSCYKFEQDAGYAMIIKNELLTSVNIAIANAKDRIAGQEDALEILKAQLDEKNTSDKPEEVKE